MSGFKYKSKENRESGELLRRNNPYNTSIHCYYYSALQFLKYTLTNIFDKTYRTLEKECKARQYPQTSHDFYISYIKNNKKSLEDNEELGNFILTIKKLKELRNIADYQEDDIERSDAENAEKLADKSKEYLIKNESSWKKKK